MTTQTVRGCRRIWTGLVIACLFGGSQLVTAPKVSAHAEAITGYKFTPPSAIVSSLVTGPDGALWFTWATPQPGTGLTRATTGGVATTIPLPSTWGAPFSVGFLTSGAGSLWISESHDNHWYIGRWNTVGSLIAEYPVPTPAWAITFGPDGNIWFSGGDATTLSGGYIGRMTPTGTVTTFPMPDPTHLVAELTAGPDGAVWFSEAPGTNVGRISATGTITEFPIPGAPTSAGPGQWTRDITFGSDGALWLKVPLMDGLERMTISGGTFTNFPTQSYPGFTDAPLSLTSGPDGNLWFTVPVYAGIDVPPLVEKMTTTGAVTIYPIPASISIGEPTVITSGPDGALWFGGQGSTVARLDPAIPPDALASTGVTPSVPGTGVTGTRTIGFFILVAGLALLLGATHRRRTTDDSAIAATASRRRFFYSLKVSWAKPRRTEGRTDTR